METIYAKTERNHRQRLARAAAGFRMTTMADLKRQTARRQQIAELKSALANMTEPTGFASLEAELERLEKQLE